MLSESQPNDSGQAVSTQDDKTFLTQLRHGNVGRFSCHDLG